MNKVQYVTDSEGNVIYVQLSYEEYKSLIMKAKDKDVSDELKVDNVIPNKAYSIENIRKEHKSAYMPWTKEEERALKMKYFEGIAIGEIATAHGRKKGAIISRLKKIGISIGD